MRENFSVKGSLHQWLKISIEALKHIGASRITQDPKYARLMADFPDGTYLLLNMRRKENNRILLEFDASSSNLIGRYKSAAAKIYRANENAERNRQERRFQQEAERRAEQIAAQQQPRTSQTTRTSRPSMSMEVMSHDQQTKPVSNRQMPSKSPSALRNDVESLNEQGFATSIPASSRPQNRPSQSTGTATAVSAQSAQQAAYPSSASQQVASRPSSQDSLAVAEQNELASTPRRTGMRKRRDQEINLSDFDRTEDEKSFTQMYEPDENDFIEQTQYINAVNPDGTPVNPNDKTEVLLHKFRQYGNQMWLIWLMLIVLPPLGLFMLWYFKRMKMPVRIVTSIVIFLYMILIWLSFLGIDTGFNKTAIQGWYDDARKSVTSFFKNATGSSGSTVKPTDRSDTDTTYSSTETYVLAKGDQLFSVELPSVYQG